MSISQEEVDRNVERKNYEQLRSRLVDAQNNGETKVTIYFLSDEKIKSLEKDSYRVEKDGGQCIIYFIK